MIAGRGAKPTLVGGRFTLHKRRSPTLPGRRPARTTAAGPPRSDVARELAQTGIPATGPAQSLEESGNRAGAIIHGKITAVGAEPSGLVYMTVAPVGESQTARAVTLRAVIRDEGNRLVIVQTSGQFVPTVLTDVVIVANRIDGREIPQPQTGVYVVDEKGSVHGQAGSPLAGQADKMTVSDLLTALATR